MFLLFSYNADILISWCYPLDITMRLRTTYYTYRIAFYSAMCRLHLIFMQCGVDATTPPQRYLALVWRLSAAC